VKSFPKNEYCAPTVVENSWRFEKSADYCLDSLFSATDFSLLSVYFAGTVLLLLRWQRTAIIV
jgi:hypothetical protein